MFLILSIKTELRRFFTIQKIARVVHKQGCIKDLVVSSTIEHARPTGMGHPSPKSRPACASSWHHSSRTKFENWSRKTLASESLASLSMALVITQPIRWHWSKKIHRERLIHPENPVTRVFRDLPLFRHQNERSIQIVDDSSLVVRRTDFDVRRSSVEPRYCKAIKGWAAIQQQRLVTGKNVPGRYLECR